MKSNTGDNIFEWQKISIAQSSSAFKVGTDAILLGSWIPVLIKEPRFILDVGTGTGVLALKLSNAYPLARIDAIDQDEHAVSLTAYNFEISDAKNRLNVRLENIFDSVVGIEIKYDLVVCNPPYFFSNANGHDEQLLLAKHTKHATSNWIAALVSRIKHGGHICVVFPFAYAHDWIRSANERGMYVQDRLDVYSFGKDHKPKRSLLHFSNQLVKPRLQTLIIYDNDRRPTIEYLEFSGLKP